MVFDISWFNVSFININGLSGRGWYTCESSSGIGRRTWHGFDTITTTCPGYHRNGGQRCTSQRWGEWRGSSGEEATLVVGASCTFLNQREDGRRWIVSDVTGCSCSQGGYNWELDRSNRCLGFRTIEKADASFSWLRLCARGRRK